MRTTSTRAIQFSLVLGILALTANYGVPKAASQDAGWVTLFDGKSLDGWDQVGESNWHVERTELSSSIRCRARTQAIW
jgi:hypothetical protein